MGSVASAAASPPTPPAQPQEGASPYGVGLAGILPPRPEGEGKEEKVDYLNLPCPVPFEEIQREALSSSPFLFSFNSLTAIACELLRYRGDSYMLCACPGVVGDEPAVESVAPPRLNGLVRINC